jgi:hypothetical protein
VEGAFALVISKNIHRCFIYLVNLLACVAILLLPVKTACAVDPFAGLDKIEMHVKMVCHAKRDFTNPDNNGGYCKDQYNYTVIYDGTFKYEPVIPLIYYQYRNYPITIEYKEVERNIINISCAGVGDSYCLHYYDDVKYISEAPYYIVKTFADEEQSNWSYQVDDPNFSDMYSLITDLKITLDHENAPPHYRFLVQAKTEDHPNIAESGTSVNTHRSFNGEQKYYHERYNVLNGTSIDPVMTWSSEYGEAPEGDLSYDGNDYIASDEVSYNYIDNYGHSGSGQISYEINHKPAVKDIQPIQVLGRYDYTDDNNYVPAADFVAGKDTVVEVFLADFMKAEEQNTARVKIQRDGADVATLTSFEKDKDNNGLIFIPPSRSACGNWQAGTYKFVAKVGDSDEAALDDVQFKEQRDFKILAVPVIANYGGTVKTPDSDWKKGSEFIRRVYPVAYDKFTYDQSAKPFDASDISYDQNNEEGWYKLWQDLKNYQNDEDPYNVIFGFIPEPAPGARGYTYAPPAVVVSVKNPVMMKTIAHEAAHTYDVGDEYTNGTFNLGVNSPPYGYWGKDWYDSDKQVTAKDPKVECFPGGQGSLISKKLIPYDTGKGKNGLLNDSMSFMGAYIDDQSVFWISPSIWMHLFNTLNTSAAASETFDRALSYVAVGTRVATVSGLISRTGEVVFSLPCSSYITTNPIAPTTGIYTIRAVGEAGNVLAGNCFSPSFITLSDPPQETDRAPFAVKVPFPEGTKKFQIVDQNDTVLKELAVSPGVPTVSVTAPAAGSQVAGTAAITWTAADPDGDSLYYKVEYTPDGVKWQTLAFKLTGNSLTQDFSQLPGGNKAQIRVTASDGVNCEKACSGIFQAPLKGPEVFIEEPSDNSSFSAAEGVVLSGSAYDPQEGQINDDNRLIWASDRAGEIGRGPAVYTRLSAGRHTISLTAVNSAGLSNVRSITLDITPGPEVTGITGALTWQVAPESTNTIPQAEVSLWAAGSDRSTAATVLTQQVDIAAKASDNNGSFQLTGLQPGSYDITLKLPYSLRAIKSSVTVTRDAMTDVDFGEIILGDTWGEEGPDNVIDVSDYSAILYSFGSVPGDGKYIDTCDLNRDGVVDVSDYSIVLYNFGKYGEAPF